MPNRRRASRRALPLSGPCQLTVAKRRKSWRAYLRPEFRSARLAAALSGSRRDPVPYMIWRKASPLGTNLAPGSAPESISFVVAAQPLSQAGRIDPLPVERCQRLLARVPSTPEGATFAKAADGKLDPLAYSRGMRPERQPIAALDCLTVLALKVNVATHARQTRFVVPPLDPAIFSTRHWRMLTKNLIAKRLGGAQCFTFAAMRAIAEVTSPDSVPTLNGDDPGKGAVTLIVDPRDAIVGTWRSTRRLAAGLADHRTRRMSGIVVAHPEFNEVEGDRT